MKKKRQLGNVEAGKADSDLAGMVDPMRDLIAQQKKIYVERHEYRKATAADMKHLDRKWYDAAERELIGLGYRLLDDVVDETIAQMGMCIVIRRFISADGANAAAVFQFVQGSGSMKVDLRVCDIETEFSDASFLTTSNAEASAAASLPKQIRSTKYPAGTSITELAARHEEAKRKLLGQEDGLRVVEIRKEADYEAMQHRQEAIKAAFRQGIGYLDPAEVRRIAEQQSPDEPLAAGIAAATADITRRHEQMKEENPPAAGLMGALMGGDEKQSPEDLAKLAMAAMLQQQPGVPEDKKDEITATLSNLFASADSGDDNAGMHGLLKLMGQLQELEPKEQKEAKQRQFMEAMANAQAEAERREAAHVEERLAKGLSEKAGTGEAEPEILIHGLPVGQLDYKDEPRALDAMVKEIKASKSRRDAKTLARLPLGHSRIGGLPDLPPGVAWPTHRDKKIPFVAQLDLAEFPKAARPLLPERGYLYAFALISNDEAHWPPPVNVFLYEGDAKSLVRAKFPADKDIWEDWCGERVYEVLPATTKPKGRDAKKRSNKSGETIGWLQGSMDECFGTPGEMADAAFADGDDWINLLAVESDGSMQWSDAGHLYFLIRRSALEKHDFSRVLAVVGSS